MWIGTRTATHPDNSPEGRREFGTWLAAQLEREVAELVMAYAPSTPEFVEETAALTAPSDAAFLVALTSWEATGSPAAAEELRLAYLAVYEAYGRAATEWDVL